MIDLEEFTTDYRSYVEKWFYKRIKTDDFKPSFDDFWSYVIQEFLRRDTLSKFKEDHFSNAQFTTWLFVVLERHFSDFRRKEKKYDWVGITPINQPEEKGVISERKLGFVDISILESPSELAYVINIINHIPNDIQEKERQEETVEAVSLNKEIDREDSLNDKPKTELDQKKIVELSINQWVNSWSSKDKIGRAHV